MTCQRVFYGLLAALFAYVTVTVAAFRYLQWWQAILLSALTLVLMVAGGKLLVRTAVGRIGSMVQTAMAESTKVLRNASVDVHAVRPAGPPADLLADADNPDADEFDRAEAAADLRTLRWFEVELSVFPDANEAGGAAWSPTVLTAVPATTRVGGPPDADPGCDLRDLRVLADGDARPADDELTGPQRLRFLVGVPAGVRALALRYAFHQFGRIELPTPALPRGPS